MYNVSTLGDTTAVSAGVTNSVCGNNWLTAGVELNIFWKPKRGSPYYSDVRSLYFRTFREALGFRVLTITAKLVAFCAAHIAFLDTIELGNAAACPAAAMARKVRRVDFMIDCLRSQFRNGV